MANLLSDQVQGFRLTQIKNGNPERDLVHATGCKQPTLRLLSELNHILLVLNVKHIYIYIYIYNPTLMSLNPPTRYSNPIG
jgi:hypothetical protein